MSEQQQRPTRVFVHVGSPKTGTTFLQNVLWDQKATARAQGLLLPMQRFYDHFVATLDVRGLADDPSGPISAVGMWQRIVEQSSVWPGNVLISHELFAGADATQAARAMAAFPSHVELHVVLTARDLLRQIPAEWQEHVKHRSTKRMNEFTRMLKRDTEHTSWFWLVQNYPDVLRRWGAGLPPERVHVVTVPPRGADPTLLWRRFTGLLGLDPDAFDTSVARGNLSLGRQQAELLRRVNVALAEADFNVFGTPGVYPRWVKEMFAQTVLSSRPGEPIALGPRMARFAVEESERIATELESMGVDVIGDLAELVPQRQSVPRAKPAPVRDEAVLDEAAAAIAELLRRLAVRDGRGAAFQAKSQELEEHPWRFAARATVRRHPRLRQAARGALRVRGAVARRVRRVRRPTRR